MQFEIDGARSEVTVEMAGAGRAEGPSHSAREGPRAGLGPGSIPADANPADNDFWFVFEQPARPATIVVADDAAGRAAAAAGGVDFARSGRSVHGRSGRARSVGGGRVGPGRAASVAGPAARTRRGQAGASVHRARRAGDLLSAAKCPVTSSCSASLDIVDGQKAGRPRSRAGGAIRICSPTRERRRCPSAACKIRRYCGLAGELTPLAAFAAAPPCWRGSRPDAGAVYFCADHARAGRFVAGHERRRASTSSCSALWPPARALGKHAAARRPASRRETILPFGSALAGSRGALSTEYPVSSRRL